MSAEATSSTSSCHARYAEPSSVAFGIGQCRIELAADLQHVSPRLHARLLQPAAWAAAASAVLDVRALDLPVLRSRATAHEDEFARARRQYTDWVLAEQRDALLPDPVLTVSADELLIEATSSDGRAYAAVLARGSALDHVAPPAAGTTTCACPSRWHRALRQVRPYRATEIAVASRQGTAPIARGVAERTLGPSNLWRHAFARTQDALACVALGGNEEWVGPLALAPTDLLLLSRALARPAARRAHRFALALSPGDRVRVTRDGTDDVAVLTTRWDGAPESLRLWGGDAWSALAPIARVSMCARAWIARSGAFVCVVECGDVAFTLAYAGRRGAAPRIEADECPAVEAALGEHGPSDVARLEQQTRLSAPLVRAALGSLAVRGRASVDVGTGRWRQRQWRPAVSVS